MRKANEQYILSQSLLDNKEQGREESQQQGNSISQVPEINLAPQRKKQQEEELDQPRKKSRGFGMGM